VQRVVRLFTGCIQRIFGHDGVQRDVPVIDTDRMLFLQFIGDTQQPRLVPVGAPLQERKAAVIKAATHADAVTAGIEGDERGKHQVQCGGLDQVPANRLEDTVTVIDQFITRLELCKPELVALEWNQSRQVTRLPDQL